MGFLFMLKDIGQKGENIAKAYMLKKGFSFVAANWRYKHKEIDLIFRNNDGFFIFIEVKTRKFFNKNKSSFIPFLSKQNKNIKEAALNYCLQNKIKLEQVRFDLILITYKEHKATLHHYCDIWR